MRFLFYFINSAFNHSYGSVFILRIFVNPHYKVVIYSYPFVIVKRIQCNKRWLVIHFSKFKTPLESQPDSLDPKGIEVIF